MSLPALLATMVAILQVHSVCENVSVLETASFSADQFFIKIRADLTGQYKLQVRVYYNQGHVDYAYQLFAHVPILRWDNKEEFPSLSTYPHHYHDEQGCVKASPLSGLPYEDLPVVLHEVAAFISSRHA